MTLNVTVAGQFKVLTDLQLVEQAFRDSGLDPRDLDPGFIPYWIAQGKSLDEILAIASNRKEEPRA